MSFTHALCTSCLVLASIRALAPQKFMSGSCYGRARQFSQLRRKTPSRMTLSPRVSQQATPKVAPNGQRAKPRSAGPFGGMNMRQADIRGEPERRAVSQSGGKDRARDQRGGTRAAPRDDFKALKMQRALSPISYSHRTAIKSRISDIDNFSQFPLLPTILEAIKDQALKGLKEISPTPVQRLAIPELLGEKSKFGQRRPRAVAVNSGDAKKMEQYLVAAETGSGKTLAYLLPTIDAIKRAETLDEDVAAHQVAVTEEKRQLDLNEIESPVVSHQPHPTTGRPRAIILVPTAELVSQVGKLIKALSHTIKFRSALISSAYTGRVVRSRLFSPAGIDLLVSTPHLLASIAESDPNILSRVTHLIIDEADSLLDRSFSPLTTAIIDRATPSLQQLILCSATIPRSLDTYLRQRFPDIRRLVTPNLHAIPRRVQLGVVDVDKDPYHGNKNLACADTIYNIGNAAAEQSESSENGVHDQDQTYEKRILVFVNEREHAKEVANFLVGKGIDAHALTRDTPEQRQSELLKEFTDGNAVLPSSNKKEASAVAIEDDKATYMPANALTPAPRRTLAKTKVLVTTDLGSRGIDTLAVRHVILYDVPHTTIDFIHRLGRTGRMGRRGRAVVLVGRGDRRDVVREVRDGMYKGQALI